MYAWCLCGNWMKTIEERKTGECSDCKWIREKEENK